MEFLMQQMELREELEAVRERPDPYAVVLDLGNRVNQQITSLVGQMAVQFETPSADQLEAAREILRKMRFLQKLRSEAERVAGDLEDEMH
jgi:molecular chaperone HscB